ncbi:MAG: hypothetical protein A3A96_03890 [Candidatus Zambryskibacteria bacterium RIFCSPLOWO2_01_FULL_39_39]|uniref:HNH nuclease domain-containing protein n=1 Tax=Candidatus Zambryskibacteria bacterium RIFCSPLOWO2_01_FULL_39_39 TaxID=1802758 RepID=A0A1G2TZ75_9BACT|nr:MAG: HNH nuclease [Parcubacteria group bacterium GW2011_GWA1_38_7]OHA87089.1 MAG: hypothetical protein A2644_03475 [Candidatus Zambryskibacteria bacterium RIFCSPHIGHO2_01_FULL_39_63]OHA94630.1 MAG: hypothetical protein A3B88_00280 [Candidatus Zambryskibacteria bacterium RIFCSPHIGHO2_02_FULL_39_19]OHA98081.1 MAG: hypothetical protein A3F20_01180 [Candidatus Zambryskibacteria bacterium RIFCSPHIGHO2_12_FULL_39_21]OHB02544.1 MAG: hypothetical protein A3A96_03890 [Candidatus Zambryskibacteria bac
MTVSYCKVCNNKFYPRPSNIKRGWGVYCSISCKNIGTQVIRQKVFCFICKKELMRTTAQLSHSKSGNFFCSKSCQTKWRNTEFIGPKHANFKDGKNSYQSVLKRYKIKQICNYCGEKDTRILAIHHIDENHKNNDINNLTWLCHNCHSLVHYDSVEKQKFLTKHKKQCKQWWS